MLKDDTNLIWIDIETTGLDPDINEILEVCCVITNKTLDVKAVSDSFVIKVNKELLINMNEWCLNTHAQNGLIKEAFESTLTIKDVEDQILEFLRKWVDYKTSPMCGSSVHFDRIFLKRHMPRLEDFFSYRNLDVSSMKEVVYRWYDFVFIKDEDNHRAKSDIIQSISELKFYKENFFIKSY